MPIIIPEGSEQYLNSDSDYIFNQDKVRTYRLILTPSDLAEINSNPMVEEYVEGMLIFEEDTISPVGIRYKGGFGAFLFCLSEKFHPSEHKVCSK